jgi:hypothetical protein
MESARIAAQFRSARQIGGTYASIPDAFKAVNNGFFGSARVPFTITQIRADMPPDQRAKLDRDLAAALDAYGPTAEIKVQSPDEGFPETTADQACSYLPLFVLAVRAAGTIHAQNQPGLLLAAVYCHGFAFNLHTDSMMMEKVLRYRAGYLYVVSGAWEGQIPIEMLLNACHYSKECYGPPPPVDISAIYQTRVSAAHEALCRFAAIKYTTKSAAKRQAADDAFRGNLQTYMYLVSQQDPGFDLPMGLMDGIDYLDLTHRFLYERAAAHGIDFSLLTPGYCPPFGYSLQPPAASSAGIGTTLFSGPSIHTSVSDSISAATASYPAAFQGLTPTSRSPPASRSPNSRQPAIMVNLLQAASAPRGSVSASVAELVPYSPGFRSHLASLGDQPNSPSSGAPAPLSSRRPGLPGHPLGCYCDGCRRPAARAALRCAATNSGPSVSATLGSTDTSSGSEVSDNSAADPTWRC